MKTMRPVVFWLSLVLLLFPAVSAKSKVKEERDPENGSVMSAKTFEGLELRGIGPALMSGRIADIAIHPSDQSTWYVAVGSGGVWKTDQRRHDLGADLRRPGLATPSAA